MIIHSVIPPQSSFYEEKEETPCLEVIEWNYIKLEVQRIDSKIYKISRILTTNPFDYLKPELQPGMEIELRLGPKDE